MRAANSLKRQLTLGLGAALVLIGGCLSGGVVSAADSVEEMTISPTEKHYELSPGETVTDSFVILNSGTAEYDFTAYTLPYSVANGNYNALYDVNAPRSDAYKWVQMETTNWHAAVRQTITIPFTLRVPSNASPGGHYGVLFAETQPPEGESGIVRKKRIGMVLYVKVKGDVVNEGSVTGIGLGWFYSHAPITATVSVEDRGNTDFVTGTKMLVTDLLGNVKYSATSEYNVLPNTTRDIQLTYDTPPWFGLFKVRVEATAMGTTTVRESYVFMAPYWLILIVGIAVMLGAINVVRTRKAKASKKHAK